LVVVYENVPSRALLDAVLYRDQPWISGGKRLSESLAERPDLLLSRAANDRDIHVKTPGASGLYKTRDLQTLQRLMKAKGSLQNLLERSSFHGIEIEMQIVGSMHIVTTCIPRIEINATQIDHPE